MSSLSRKGLLHSVSWFTCRTAGALPTAVISLRVPSPQTSGVKGGWKRLDYLWRFCFRHTRNFLTIDNEQKRLIALNSPRARIKVVENYIPQTLLSVGSKEQARRDRDILDSRRVIGVIGRIQFAQKNQDWLVKQLASDPFWKDYLVLIVGDGPNLSELRRMVCDLNLGEQVRIVGWTERVMTLYPALDTLLIPSRLEGVPLVMLEALALKIPVIGTNRDGMKEWLPQEWRFEVGDGEGMKRAARAPMEKDYEEFWRATARHSITSKTRSDLQGSSLRPFSLLQLEVNPEAYSLAFLVSAVRTPEFRDARLSSFLAMIIRTNVSSVARIVHAIAAPDTPNTLANDHRTGRYSANSNRCSFAVQSGRPAP